MQADLRRVNHQHADFKHWAAKRCVDSCSSFQWMLPASAFPYVLQIFQSKKRYGLWSIIAFLALAVHDRRFEKSPPQRSSTYESGWRRLAPLEKYCASCLQDKQYQKGERRRFLNLLTHFHWLTDWSIDWLIDWYYCFKATQRAKVTADVTECYGLILTHWGYWCLRWVFCDRCLIYVYV